MTDEYAEFRPPAEENDHPLAEIAKLVEQMKQLQQAVVDAELSLKNAQQALADLQERIIPEKMESLGQTVLRLLDGTEVRVDKKIRVSLPKEKQIAAFKWLIENNHEGLIKRTISVAFSRDQQEAAKTLVEKLRSDFENVKQDMKVEPATLTAFVREELEAGREVPLDVFSVFEQKSTKLKTPSEK